MLCRRHLLAHSGVAVSFASAGFAGTAEAVGIAEMAASAEDAAVELAETAETVASADFAAGAPAGAASQAAQPEIAAAAAAAGAGAGAGAPPLFPYLSPDTQSKPTPPLSPESQHKSCGTSERGNSLCGYTAPWAWRDSEGLRHRHICELESHHLTDNAGSTMSWGREDGEGLQLRIVRGSSGLGICRPCK